jgi:hypothetical protein
VHVPLLRIKSLCFRTAGAQNTAVGDTHVLVSDAADLQIGVQAVFLQAPGAVGAKGQCPHTEGRGWCTRLQHRWLWTSTDGIHGRFPADHKELAADILCGP